MNISGIRLSPTIAQQIIENLFKEKMTWERSDIITRVDDAVKSGGGLPGTQTTKAVVKKALQRLKDSGLCENPHKGYWTPTNKIQEPASGAIQAGIETAPTPPIDDTKWYGEVIGSGPESVYVYYYPTFEKLAKSENASTWMCKVGRTSGRAIDRVGDQTSTGSPEEPVIGLVIKTDDCVNMEKILHDTLRLIGAKARGSVGAEWFRTSPSMIKEMYTAIMSVLSKYNCEDEDDE